MYIRKLGSPRVVPMIADGYLCIEMCQLYDCLQHESDGNGDIPEGNLPK